MGYDEAFCVVPCTSPQDGETMGQITEDFLRLIFHGPIPNNALWDGALTRPLDVLVVPKNKKQLLFFLVQLKVFIILARIKNSFLSTYRYEKEFDICCILVRSAIVLTIKVFYLTFISFKLAITYYAK